MDTNSNILAQKKIVSVEILHLDELGFGPQGKHTRREWRAECLENLLAGKMVFENWQDSWIGQVDENLERVIFETSIKYEGESGDSLVGNFSKPYSLDFSGREFKDITDCKEFTFKTGVLFFGTTFRQVAPFDKAKFKDFANFRFANFQSHYVSFRDAIFDSYADFEGAILIRNFMSYLSISFENSKFKSMVNFRSINFDVNVSFKNAVFSQGANFENTKFVLGCNFEGVTFGEKNIFHKHVSGEYEMIDFTNAQFMSDAKFNNSIFNLPSSFIKCKFFGDLEFKNACFNEDVRFFAVNFYGGNFFNDSIFTGNAVKRLGQMKRLAEDNGQTDQALNFNALELDAKLKQSNTSGLFKLFTLLYKIFSDYGRSFGRPMFWYGVLICLSAILAMAYSTYSESPAEARQALCKKIKDQPPPLKLTYGQAVVEYAMFRAGGLMDFTDTGKQNNAVNCRLFEEPIEPPLMRAWGIFKGIASIALLFLAALGLRNKYRIK